MAKGDKFKNFIKKAGNIFPEIMDIGGKLVSGNWGGVIQEVGALLTKKTKSENPQVASLAGELLVEYERDREQFMLEAYRIQVDDRKDARSLYKEDDIMQKIFGVVFLIGYGFLSWYLINILINNVELPDLAETMITMVWTGTSTKLNTIVDFFFGGAMKQNNNTK